MGLTPDEIALKFHRTRLKSTLVYNLYSENSCTPPSSLAIPFDPFILGLVIGFVIGFGVLAAILILNVMRRRKK